MAPYAVIETIITLLNDAVHGKLGSVGIRQDRNKYTVMLSSCYEFTDRDRFLA